MIEASNEDRPSRVPAIQLRSQVLLKQACEIEEGTIGLVTRLEPYLHSKHLQVTDATVAIGDPMCDYEKLLIELGNTLRRVSLLIKDTLDRCEL